MTNGNDIMDIIYYRADGGDHQEATEKNGDNLHDADVAAKLKLRDFWRSTALHH